MTRSAGFQPAATPPSRRQPSRKRCRQDAGVAAGKMPALRIALLEQSA